MTRVLSALVLLPIVLGTILWLPPTATLALALVAVGLAFWEYADLAGRIDLPVSRPLGLALALGLSVAMTWGRGLTEALLLASLVAAGGAAVAGGRPDPAALRRVAGTLLGAVYVGVPLGALAAVRGRWGAAALVTIVLAVMVSDTAQFYTGRSLGRRPLSPGLSPGKTVEGALGGICAAALFLPLVARFSAISTLSMPLLAAAGAVLASAGIVGDLFESQLKRAAGVKDSSRLIPGHGGMLDRVDSLLFAAPVYYLLLAALP